MTTRREDLRDPRLEQQITDAITREIGLVVIRVLAWTECVDLEIQDKCGFYAYRNFPRDAHADYALFPLILAWCRVADTTSSPSCTSTRPGTPIPPDYTLTQRLKCAACLHTIPPDLAPLPGERTSTNPNVRYFGNTVLACAGQPRDALCEQCHHCRAPIPADFGLGNTELPGQIFCSSGCVAAALQAFRDPGPGHVKITHGIPEPLPAGWHASMPQDLERTAKLGRDRIQKKIDRFYQAVEIAAELRDQSAPDQVQLDHTLPRGGFF